MRHIYTLVLPLNAPCEIHKINQGEWGYKYDLINDPSLCPSVALSLCPQHPGDVDDGTEAADGGPAAAGACQHAVRQDEEPHAARHVRSACHA